MAEVRGHDVVRMILFITGVTNVGGCRFEDDLSAPAQRPSAQRVHSQALVSGDWCYLSASDVWLGRTRGWCNNGPETIYTVITSPSLTLWHHQDDPNSDLSPNTAPITVTFGKLVYRARVSSGDPFFLKCGAEANVTFSGPEFGGQVIRTFHQPFPNDPPFCMPQSEAMAQGALAADEVFMPGGINTITIEPPSPINWEWLCTNWNYCQPGGAVPRTVQSHGTTAYVISWQDQLVYGPLTTSCVTNDPILDLIPARQLLDSLWKLAGGDGQDSLKRERGGYLYTDSTGMVGFSLSAFDPNATACKTANVPTNIPPGTTLIASVHIHPFKHRDPTDVCHPTVLGQKYNGKDNYGISLRRQNPITGEWSGDLNGVEQMVAFPAMVGLYMMDKENIGFAPRGSTNKNIKQKGKSVPRINKNSGNCVVV